MIITAATATAAVAVTVHQIAEIQSVCLDIERKQIELSGIRENGQVYTTYHNLSDEEASRCERSGVLAVNGKPCSLTSR